MSVNKVILLGNLGRDPEVRYLDNNKVVAQFSLATSETFTDRNGDRRTDTEWHNIELWDNLAKVAEKYLKKGMQVYIEGKIRTFKWKDKEGNEQSGKRIRATSMTLVGGASRTSENKNEAAAPEATPESSTLADTGNLTDELPF
ncbi:MAG: single-stranded DNA-binding protein [Bacteroidia bacterium]